MNSKIKIFGAVGVIALFVGGVVVYKKFIDDKFSTTQEIRVNPVDEYDEIYDEDIAEEDE